MENHYQQVIDDYMKQNLNIVVTKKNGTSSYSIGIVINKLSLCSDLYREVLLVFEDASAHISLCGIDEYKKHHLIPDDSTLLAQFFNEKKIKPCASYPSNIIYECILNFHS